MAPAMISAALAVPWLINTTSGTPEYIPLLSTLKLSDGFILVLCWITTPVLSRITGLYRLPPWTSPPPLFLRSRIKLVATLFLQIIHGLLDFRRGCIGNQTDLNDTRVRRPGYQVPHHGWDRVFLA